MYTHFGGRQTDKRTDRQTAGQNGALTSQFIQALSIFCDIGSRVLKEGVSTKAIDVNDVPYVRVNSSEKTSNIIFPDKIFSRQNCQNHCLGER